MYIYIYRRKISSIINPSISIQYNERIREGIDENHAGYVKSVTIYGKPFKIIQECFLRFILKTLII